jgi:hypothetical protein
MEQKIESFDAFLADRFMESGRADGLVKDQFETVFEAWLADLDGAELIEFGNRYGQEVARKFEAYKRK